MKSGKSLLKIGRSKKAKKAAPKSARGEKMALTAKAIQVSGGHA